MGTPERSSWSRPRGQLWTLLLGGLLVQVAGCVLAFANLPRADVGAGPGWPVLGGDPELFLVGVLGLGLGGVSSLVAVIGLGVSLGLRVHEDRRAGR